MHTVAWAQRREPCRLFTHFRGGLDNWTHHHRRARRHRPVVLFNMPELRFGRGACRYVEDGRAYRPLYRALGFESVDILGFH